MYISLSTCGVHVHIDKLGHDSVVWLQLQEKEDEYKANLQAAYRQVSSYPFFFIAVLWSG